MARDDLILILPMSTRKLSLRGELSKGKRSNSKLIPKQNPNQQNQLKYIKHLPKPTPIDFNQKTQKIKLVFLGDGNCGKTSSLISYTSDNFNLDYVPTIFDTYESVIKKGTKTVKLQLWDTAGQDEYRKLRSLSYPKTDVFLICFSIVDQKTFTNAITKWINEVKDNCPRAEVMFVGTKIDLIADHKISQEDADKVLDEQKISKKISSMGYKLKLCSALTQKGLNEVFDSAIEQVLKKRMNKDRLTKRQGDGECQLI